MFARATDTDSLGEHGAVEAGRYGGEYMGEEIRTDLLIKDITAFMLRVQAMFSPWLGHRLPHSFTILLSHE